MVKLVLFTDSLCVLNIGLPNFIQLILKQFYKFKYYCYPQWQKGRQI